MRKFRYSTNWMGPISIEWYEDRNLTTKKTIMVKGELIETKDIIQQWSGGRIDVRGGDTGDYGDEISLPVMRGDCYEAFSDWLETFETDEMWTLKELVSMYEKTNPKIEWDELPEWYDERT
jgi:hypothetical protein